MQQRGSKKDPILRRLRELRELWNSPGELSRLRQANQELGRELESMQRQAKALAQAKRAKAPKAVSVVPPEQRGPSVLLLHPGAHKTGTTSLQRLLTRNAPRLAERGVLPLAHHRPPCPLSSGKEFSFKRDFRTPFREILDDPDKDPQPTVDRLRELAEQVDQKARVLLLSDEEILGPKLDPAPYLYPNAARGLELLQEIFPSRRLQIIFYIRHQDAFLESCYMQSVHVRESISFDQFLARIDLDQLSWSALLGRMSSVVDPTQIVVRPFESIRDGFVPFAQAYFRLFTETEGLDIREFRDNPRLSVVGFNIAQATAPLVTDEEWAELRAFLQKTFSVSPYRPAKDLLGSRRRTKLKARYAADYAAALEDYPRTLPDLPLRASLLGNSQSV